jgi:hypothetical protein
VQQARVALIERVAVLPGVTVEEANGHVGFFVGKKRMAWMLVDHHGDGRLAVWLKAPQGEQRALVRADPRRYFAPPYLGASGWVAALVDRGSDPDWDEIAALLEQAWRMTAGKRVVAAFDEARRSPG